MSHLQLELGQIPEVGGTHAINDRWSVNASYNLELMERANSHSANIGTSYRF